MPRVYSMLILLWVFSFTAIVPHSYGTTITWNQNIEEDLGGYNFYCGTSSGYYTTVIDLGNVTSYAFTDLFMYEHVPYFVALTAYDIADNESSYSLELALSLDDDIDYEDNCPDVYNPDQKDTYPPGGNGIGDACECNTDFDCNQKVDLADVAILKQEFSRTDCSELDPCFPDCNGDGKVDLIDLVIMKTEFLRTDCPACP